MPFDFTEEDFAPKSKFDFTEQDFTPNKSANEFGLPRFKPLQALSEPTQKDIEDAQTQASPLKDIGRGLHVAGKSLIAGLADVGDVLVTEGQKANKAAGVVDPVLGEYTPHPRGENIKALMESGGMGPLPAEDLRPLPRPLQMIGRGAQGLIETTPKLAAVAGAQAMGIPAPLAAGAVFGLTPEGFDPVQGAVAAVLPFVGKYSGAMVEALAGELGVTKDVALAAFNKMGGATGAAGYLKAIDESEIAKLPPEQRDQARIDSWANVASQAALGMMGEREISKESKPVVEEVAKPKESSASVEQKSAEVHGSVLSQPRINEGKVPSKESVERIQPQTERRVQKEEVTPQSIASMPLEDFQKYHDSLKGESEGISNQRRAVNELARGMDTVKQITDAEKLAIASRSKTASLNEDLLKQKEDGKSYQELESAFREAQMENQRTQFIDEAVRTAKARQAVEGGMSVEDAVGNFGVHEASLRSVLTEPKPETVLTSQSTSAHGLPPGVPDRGPAFAADLMEASRQLGALVRSRATLRPGVQGQFVRTKLAGIKQQDRIEVGDIRNQNTVAHEIGHSLDGILFPQQNFGESQASLAARVGTGTGKELSQELTKVSELMRGPMTGSKGHIAYRRRATELIADYFSLYAHDRDHAASMAPKFTKGFEAVMAKDRNTADVVSGIRSGNVIPKPPNTTLPKALAGITGTPPQLGTKIPGQVPASPQLPPPARERVAAVAAEGLVKDAVRTFESKVQKARIVGDNWRKFVPDQVDRNDVGAFVEGIGNLEKPGDTIDRVRTRMTPAKERLAKDYRFRQELERQEINSYLKGTEEGEYLKFLEDYLGHFYVDNTAKRQAAVSRWAKESPHAKQRKLPTLKEAVDMGLTPITQDPAVTYELNSRINWQVATNRKFVSKLKDITTGGGQPVVVPAKDAPAGWVATSNPLIQRVYARQTPSGLMLWRGGAAIHPDIWRSARQILEAPVAGDLGKAYDAINGFTRANAFAFSLFHDLTLRSAAIGSMARVTNPLRGLVRLFERHPITGERQVFASTRGLGKELLQNEETVSDAAEHGLKFSYTDSEAYQHNARTFLERRAAQFRDVPVLGKATRLARDIQQWRQEGLWKNTHDAFKVITYHDLVSKALDRAPQGTDTKAVKEQIASYLNDAYGGQEWQTKFWLDPATRKIVSRFFLAPDWTLSTIRSVPGLSDVASTAREQAPRLAGRETFPTQKEGVSGAGKRLRFWGAEIAALALATAAAQYAIYKAFGDDKKGDKPMPWDNELDQKMRVDVTPLMRKFPWSDLKDPTRHYVNLGKRPQEILNWFTEPDKQVLSKSSRPVAMIFEQVTGSEGDFKAPWKQDHESFVESIPSRAKAIGTEALPFTFRGNQFALSAPVRKGMTKYKAQQAYESVFELAADPNRLRSLLRGQQPSEGSILEMTSQITDAAKRNGVPAEEVLKRSLSVVRGHHYSEFFKAFEKGDHKKMDEEAKALLTLGATNKGLEESIKRRIQLEPQSPASAIVVP